MRHLHSLDMSNSLLISKLSQKGTFLRRAVDLVDGEDIKLDEGFWFGCFVLLLLKLVGFTGTL